jgi:hypothetical protein
VPNKFDHSTLNDDARSFASFVLLCFRCVILFILLFAIHRSAQFQTNNIAQNTVGTTTCNADNVGALCAGDGTACAADGNPKVKLFIVRLIYGCGRATAGPRLLCPFLVVPRVLEIWRFFSLCCLVLFHVFLLMVMYATSHARENSFVRIVVFFARLFRRALVAVWSFSRRCSQANFCRPTFADTRQFALRRRRSETAAPSARTASAKALFVDSPSRPNRRARQSRPHATVLRGQSRSKNSSAPMRKRRRAPTRASAARSAWITCVRPSHRAQLSRPRASVLRAQSRSKNSSAPMRRRRRAPTRASAARSV